MAWGEVMARVNRMRKTVKPTVIQGRFAMSSPSPAGESSRSKTA
jgi:hypothetical protein